MWKRESGKMAESKFRLLNCCQLKKVKANIRTITRGKKRGKKNAESY